MTEYLNALSHHIFNKSFTDCTLQDVRNLAQQYPYFAPAQFLLLKKLQPDSPEYATQYQRAILYHYNPLEFEHFFHPEKFASDFDPGYGTVLQDNTAEPARQMERVPPADSEDQVIAETILEEETPAVAPMEPELTSVEMPLPEEASTEDLTVAEEILEEETDPEPETVQVAETPEVVVQAAEVIEQEEIAVPEKEAEQTEEGAEETEAVAAADEERQVAAEQKAEQEEFKTGIPSDEETHQPEEREPLRELEISETIMPAETTLEATRLPEKEEEATREEEPAEVPETVPAPEPEPEKVPLKEEPAAAEVLSFEPFHTVDYFASMGIKLSQEEAPKDRIGKQLKSFTEWLKTMKKLNPTESVPAIDASSENRVQSLASHSVQEADVVTEAMAEVWVKQGNTPKAIDVYNKLGLQNPAKKAYFAAKIETLKKSS